MKHLWRNIGAIWPHDRSFVSIDVHLGEEGGVPSQRLEDGTPEMGRQVDLADCAVAKVTLPTKSWRTSTAVTTGMGSVMATA